MDTNKDIVANLVYIIYKVAGVIEVRGERLELEEMGLVTLLQAERRGKVLLEKRGLLDLSKQSAVDSLLVSNTLLLDLLLLSISEELLLSSSLLGSLLTGKVSHVELVDVNTLQGHTSGGSNNITGVNSSERNTVHLEGTRHKQSVVLKSLEEHNTLASESTGEDDQDSARNQGWSQSSGLLGLAVNLGGRSGLGGVPLLSLLGGDDSLASVLCL